MNPNLKADILTRVDAISIYRTKIPALKQVHNLYVGLCPFHDEKTPSFKIYPDAHYHCFGCGAHGDIIDFLQAVEHLTFYEALQSLANQAGIPLTVQADMRETNRLSDLLNECIGVYTQALKTATSALADKARRYLDDRGIDQTLIDIFSLGFAPEGNKFSGFMISTRHFKVADLVKIGLMNSSMRDTFQERIMFPIYSYAGRPVGFGARVIGDLDTRAKYLNSKTTLLFDKSNLVYGLNMQHSRVPYLCVVEGYMDVLTAWKYGYAATVASMGSHLTSAQLKAVSRVTNKVVLVYDGDEAGFRALEKQAVVYVAGLEVNAIPLPKGTDPADMINSDPGSWGELLKGSSSIYEVYMQHLLSTAPVKTATEKEDLTRKIVPVLVNLPPVTKDHWIHYYAREIGVTPASIHKMVRAYITTPAFPPSDTGIPPIVTQPTDIEEYLLASAVINPTWAKSELKVGDFNTKRGRTIIDLVLNDRSDLPPELSDFFDHLLEISNEIQPGEEKEFLNRLRYQNRRAAKQ